MLKHLHIRDFAIIDELHLDFCPGMTALSGETGAGKSILIDALGLLLGDRAEAGVVRQGRERADISAEFSLADTPLARDWLIEHELGDTEHADQCLIRRSLAADGRGRAFINGSAVTIRDLKELGETLLDIHGQHAHQSLLKPEVQRTLLDGLGGHDAQLEALRSAYQLWRKTTEELRSLSESGADPQRLEFLRFQINELMALNLKPGEAEEIDAEHRRLSHAGQLLEEGQRVIALLYDDDSQAAHRLIAQAQQLLEKLGSLDSAFADAAQTLNTPLDLLRDTAERVRDRLDTLDLDPDRLAWLESRVDALHNLARKHRCKPAELPALLDQMQQELARLEGADTRREALEQTQARLAADYQSLAAKLSLARSKAAKSAATDVQTLVRQLGMPQAVFEIAVTPMNDATPRAQGLDEIDYRISANPGQPGGSLAKVASGGELSRIALAIQVVGAKQTQVPSLIFDEVDTGIGGGVAEIVGRQLRALGTTRQALCVTHLPQVAAQAHQHLQVRKEIRDGQTYTQVKPLDRKARVDEIARMLGGVEITAQTRALAEQMLKSAR